MNATQVRLQEHNGAALLRVAQGVSKFGEIQTGMQTQLGRVVSRGQADHALRRLQDGGAVEVRRGHWRLTTDGYRVARALGFLMLLLAVLPLNAMASGNSNQNNSDKGGVQTTTVSANPVAVSGSNASAGALAGAKAGAAASSKSNVKTGDSTSIGINANEAATGPVALSADDNSVYKEARQHRVAAEVAALTGAYCNGQGASVSTWAVGGSLTTRDYVCAETQLAGAYLAIGNLPAAEGALKAAELRLNEDNTRVRRFFVTVFGSLPFPLSALAPR